MNIKKLFHAKHERIPSVSCTNRQPEVCEHCRSWQNKYNALEKQYRCAQEECQALREECQALRKELAHRVQEEGRQKWQTNWKY